MASVIRNEGLVLWPKYISIPECGVWPPDSSMPPQLLWCPAWKCVCHAHQRAAFWKSKFALHLVPDYQTHGPRCGIFRWNGMRCVCAGFLVHLLYGSLALRTVPSEEKVSWALNHWGASESSRSRWRRWIVLWLQLMPSHDIVGAQA